MKLRDFSIIVCCSLCINAFSQHRITGTVVFQQDSTAVMECSVYLNNGKQSTLTDAKGRFKFVDLPNGQYQLHAVSDEGKYSKVEVNIDGKDEHVTMVIDAYSHTLDEVTVTQSESDFGFTRMAAVENMGIYEGKKSEVILPDLLVASTATNNARQVYSRVAGLNIYEVDASGLQLAIGGRGLDPNRTANFNVRQNGYDISADALGYPESYYTPPIEGVGEIQIVRGAASLQYGTQFGGLINFIMKKPNPTKKIELVARQTVGSYGFYNTFTSVSGTVKKISYYSFFQYKRGDGWRLNSEFDSYTGYANVNYQFTKKTSLGLDVTKMGYLAHQPGGLTYRKFLFNPQQSNRDRNWFKVDWNLIALHFSHKFNTRNEVNLRLFGLSAYRYSLGFRPNRVDEIDKNEERDLIKGDILNWGIEARYLKHYAFGEVPGVALFGIRYYHGFNQAVQGYGSKGKDADFNIIDPNYISHDYSFPNRNIALFAENIFYVHEKVSITPGIRYEYIHTKGDGYYRDLKGNTDLAGNVLSFRKKYEIRTNGRQFLLGGVGLGFRPHKHLNLYTNISQNFRSITFSDMRITNPSTLIDPNMQDERGYSFDIGARSEGTSLYNYDVSFFYLNYNNRIGEVRFYDEFDRELRRRGNIGQAVILGIESYLEGDFIKAAFSSQKNWSGVLFGNLAFIKSYYAKSENTAVVGKQVEFVPNVNIKSGLRFGYKNFKASFQYTYLSNQYADATNQEEEGFSAVVGRIPAYSIVDASLSYEYKWFKIESSVLNLLDKMYFTRRATGYPGPGILPSDGRTFYVTLQVKI